jgi:predicted acyl esterase
VSDPTPPRSVSFDSQGLRLAGDLYLPAGEGPHPMVVMAGGWCYVKELVMPHYARVFVEAGMAVLVFDYRCLGASEGEPRQHLDPWAQIEDYRNAISFVRTLPEVDPDRVGVWGISYSGGHVLVLGALDRRIRCIVANIPVVDGWRNMRRIHGTIGFRNLRAALEEDRERRFRGEPSGRIAHSTIDYANELSSWPFPETYETFMKLRETEAPRHEHWSTLESTELLLAYDVMPYVGRILDTPTMVIVAEEDDLTLWDLEIGAYNGIATARKELIVLPHTTHMTLYSDRSRLELAANAARDWLARYL